MAKSHLSVIAAAIVGIASVLRPSTSSAEMSVSVNPSNMPRLGTVDARYQSYNVEMVEVTGGRFWKPYANPGHSNLNTSGASSVPDLYAYRPPIDLANPKLRKLATALGPAYLRVSGTWANSTYFADSDRAPSSPPPGFKDVLTRPQWKGVVDFAAAVDAEIVTSMAISAGARDASGVWTPEQARRLIEFTRSIGGGIAAAEFMNEPAIAAIGGAPKGYDTAAYTRDFKVFEHFARQAVPGMIILGPGSGDETAASDAAARDRSEGAIASRDILQQTGTGIDVFSAAMHGHCRHAPEQPGRAGAFGRPARKHGPGVGILQKPSRRVRAWQAGLADRDGRGGLWRRPSGSDLSRHFSLSRPAWPAGRSGRASRDAQHAGGQRLRPA
jgi:hypothetical protein